MEENNQIRKSDLIESIEARFILRKIDFNDIIKKYKEKYFTRVNSRKEITLSEAINFETKIFEKDNRFFIVKDKYNSEIIFFRNKFQPIKRCFFCIRDFETEILGYPITYKEINDSGNIKYIFYLEGNFCSFECTLGYLLNHEKCNEYIILLNLLFNLLYPEEKIIFPRRDPRIYYSDILDQAKIHTFRDSTKLIIRRVEREFESLH